MRSSPLHRRWPVNPATTEAQGIPIGVKSALDDDDDDEIEPPSTKKRAAPANRKRKSTGRTSNTRIESDGEIDELGAPIPAPPPTVVRR